MAHLVLQIAVMVVVAHAGGALFRRLGQPRVCGEIAAGLALGPSGLGGVWPEIAAALFPPGSAASLRFVSEIGIVLLMLVVGLELHLESLRGHARAVLAVSLAGLVAPFVLGLGVAELLHAGLELPSHDVGFRLFVATALSITAIPTLARILDELRLQATRVGALATTAAALEDVVGWGLLAAVTALVSSRFDALGTGLRLVAITALGWTLVSPGRRRVTRWAAAGFGRRPFHREATLAAALGIAFLSSGVTSLLGFSAVFGAFAAGVAFGGDGRVQDHLSRCLRPVVVGLFLPVFFTYTGLRTDAGSLAGATAWLLCLTLTGAAIVGKVGGCALAARSHGLPASEAMALGLLMNTRGLMELVAAGIGLDLGLIPPSVYFMLVFMAVTTTFMTTPLVRRFVPQLGARHGP